MQLVLFKTIEQGKLDVYHNVEVYANFSKNLIVHSSIGAGMVKSYFQERFHPRFSLGIAYNSLKFSKYKFYFSPSIKGNISTFRLSNYTNLNYIEYMMGYVTGFGRKWRFIQHSYFVRVLNIILTQIAI